MSHGPQFALDYPELAHDQYVIWSGNEHVWPDARRELHYLMRAPLSACGALFTPDSHKASVFETEQEARAFIDEVNEVRPHPLPSDLRVTTVADLIVERFSETQARGKAP